MVSEVKPAGISRFLYSLCTGWLCLLAFLTVQSVSAGQEFYERKFGIFIDLVIIKNPDDIVTNTGVEAEYFRQLACELGYHGCLKAAGEQHNGEHGKQGNASVCFKSLLLQARRQGTLIDVLEAMENSPPFVHIVSQMVEKYRQWKRSQLSTTGQKTLKLKGVLEKLRETGVDFFLMVMANEVDWSLIAEALIAVEESAYPGICGNLPISATGLYAEDEHKHNCAYLMVINSAAGQDFVPSLLLKLYALTCEEKSGFALFIRGLLEKSNVNLSVARKVAEEHFPTPGFLW